MERIAIDRIRTDGGTQPRVTMNLFVVDDYTQAMRAGAVFPPVVVFFDGQDYWLADGFHRHAAATSAGLADILAEVRQGGKRDALLYSVGANADHGLRRTNDDKRRSVLILLNDPEWRGWSNVAIAEKCAVSESFVRTLRDSIFARNEDSQRLAQRNGTVYPMSTARIGASQQIAPEVRELIRDTPLADDQRDLFRLSRMEPETQRAVADRVVAGEAATVYEAFKEIRREQATTVQPLPSGAFQIVYADPPWLYEFSETATRAVENQYPTMTTEAICDLDVESLIAEDALLFLWATNPKLQEAMAVIAAWGFDYRTNLVWVKDRIGMGYWARQKHELLLVARRGAFPVPVPQLRPESVIVAPREDHSQKPAIVYEMIERMYPAATKVELFARSRRDGWGTWGNQVDGL